MWYDIFEVIDVTTGQRIRAARKNRGMTQAELAEKLSIPFQSVSQWERDVRKPKKETVQKIADALGVNYLDLYGDEDSREVAAHMKEGLRIGLSAKEGITRAQFMSEFQEQGYSFEPGETRLVRAYNRLNDIGQAQIILLTEGMAEMPRFMLDPPEDSTQPPQDASTAPSGGTDTTPSEKPPEDAGEGTENK